MKLLRLLLFLCSLTVFAAKYECDVNIIKNGKFEKPLWHYNTPHHWIRMKPNKNGGAVIAKPDDGGIVLYFTSNDFIDQIRFKQEKLDLERGKVYELSYEYCSDIDIKLKADVALLGTGKFMRAWWQLPAKNWTKVRGLFFMPKKVPLSQKAILMLQNRSRVKLWYRDVSLCKTNLKKSDIEIYNPKLMIHPVETDDILIIPGTSKTHINFIVKTLPENIWNHFTLNAEYYPESKKMISYKMCKGHISIPLKSVPLGKSIMAAKLIDKTDGAVVATTKIVIERLEKLPEGVDFSHNKIFKTANGTPMFPVGLYAGVNWGFDVQELADLGFNVIHSYGTGNPRVVPSHTRYSEKILENNYRLLKNAEKAGIGVMMGIPWQFAEKASNQHLLKKWQNLYKNSPALLFYYTDESRSVRNTPYYLINKTYNILKRNDPKRMIISYEKPDPKLKKAMDGIIININGPGIIKMIKAFLGSEKVIFHCFGQIDFKSANASSLQYTQYNFVMPVIWGARGIFYFTRENFTDPKINPEYKKISKNLLPCVKRFSKVAQVFVSKQSPPQWADNIKVSGKVEYTVFAEGGKVYILCGVNSNSNKGGSIEIPDVADKEIFDVLNNININNLNKHKIIMTPGQAYIFEIKRK